MRTTDGFDLEQQNKPHITVSNVTRAHRELAVKTMYPDCQPDSYMWIEFVESGNSNAYRTLARVAQALADAASQPATNVAIWRCGFCGGTPTQSHQPACPHGHIQPPPVPRPLMTPGQAGPVVR